MSNSIGHQILRFDRVGSTNDIAWSYAHDPANHGLVVVAEEQTSGRGRRGSLWQAPPGTSILASILIFPPSELQRPVWLTLWAALAICETISDLKTPQPALKWPNDVLLQGKKIAGVLVEQRNQVFVVGFGINLTIPHDFFERNNYASSGAVQHFVTGEVRRETVWSSLLQYLNQSYATHCNDNAIPLLSNFRRFSALEGREVLLTAGNFTYAGCIRQLQLDEIHLETKRGVCVFAPESISRIQMNSLPVDQWCSVQNPPD